MHTTKLVDKARGLWREFIPFIKYKCPYCGIQKISSATEVASGVRCECRNNIKFSESLKVKMSNATREGEGRRAKEISSCRTKIKFAESELAENKVAAEALRNNEKWRSGGMLERGAKGVSGAAAFFFMVVANAAKIILAMIALFATVCFLLYVLFQMPMPKGGQHAPAAAKRETRTHWAESEAYKNASPDVQEDLVIMKVLLQSGYSEEEAAAAVIRSMDR